MYLQKRISEPTRLASSFLRAEITIFPLGERLVTSLSRLWSDNILVNDGETESHVFNSYFEILRVSQITHVKCWSGSLQGEMTHTHTHTDTHLCCRCFPFLQAICFHYHALTRWFEETVGKFDFWHCEVMRVWPNFACAPLSCGDKFR